MNFQVERLKQLPPRTGKRWQGALFRSPTWVKEDEDSKPFRPWAALWVSTDTGLISRPVIESTPDKKFSLALDGLVNLACDPQFGGYRPEKLEVRDPALADYLIEVLSGTGIQVECRDRLMAFDEVYNELIKQLSPDAVLPDALKAKGVTVEMMRSYADAAAEFYAARPWQHLCDVDLIWIESPVIDPLLRYASIMGNGGMTYGIGFYDSPAAFETFVSGQGMEAIQRNQYWTLLFGGIEELPFGDADLWEDESLPVASDEAYPLALCYDPRGKHRRPQPDTLAFLEGLLRALARTTEAEMDSGRWQRAVPTFQGEKTFTLNLPGLLESGAKAKKGDTKSGRMPDRRAMEKVHADIERILEQHEFASEEEMLDFLNANIVGKPVPPQPPSTPLEKAQDLCYEAFEARGRRVIQLARQALEISPDCVDAYVILAETRSDAQEAYAFYEKGVEAGERLLGKAFFAEEAGRFWGILETRPYMRALLGLAQTLEDLGRRNEAIGHYQKLLQLNPNDNQGARDFLLPCLLVEGRLEEARALWKTYKDDPSAIWTYGRALLAFLEKGDNQTARKHLRHAVESNPYVPEYLLEEKPERMVPDMYRHGSEEEAIICAETLGKAWQVHPQALEWLEERTNR